MFNMHTSVRNLVCVVKSDAKLESSFCR
jgi:hypothetical protein